MFFFSVPVLIRHLWQLKTFVFLHWCLICTVLLKFNDILQRLQKCLLLIIISLLCLSINSNFSKRFANKTKWGTLRPCLQLFDKPWELVEYKYKHSSLFCSVFGETKKLDCLSLTFFQTDLQVKLLCLQIFD
jgi:hypothetical protein